MWKMFRLAEGGGLMQIDLEVLRMGILLWILSRYSAEVMLCMSMEFTVLWNTKFSSSSSSFPSWYLKIEWNAEARGKKRTAFIGALNFFETENNFALSFFRCSLWGLLLRVLRWFLQELILSTIVRRAGLIMLPNYPGLILLLSPFSFI